MPRPLPWEFWLMSLEWDSEMGIFKEAFVYIKVLQLLPKQLAVAFVLTLAQEKSMWGNSTCFLNFCKNYIYMI